MSERPVSPVEPTLEPHIRLCQMWESGQIPDLAEFLKGYETLTRHERLAVLRIDQQFRWQRGQGLSAEHYFALCPDVAQDSEAAVVLIMGEFLAQNGRSGVCLDDFMARFPDHESALRLQGQLCDALNFSQQSLPPTKTYYGPFLRSQPGHRMVGSLPVGSLPVGSLPIVPGYELFRELGRGGMGVVYLGLDLDLKRQVAVKMIHPQGLLDAEVRSRFQTEAEASARLAHPHIVQIHELGEHAGHPYLVMEMVEGGSLAQQLDGTPRTPVLAARFVGYLADAIHHAHQAGIVHRDLKPGNILLAANPDPAKEISDCLESHPKITDFGLAKLLDVSFAQTQTGAILGTPSYMAPEQADGRVHAIGPCTDVYALGAILYELLTGRPPFRGVNIAETLDQVRRAEPVPPRSLVPRAPRDLETIALCCLEKEPARRYQSAHDLAEELTRFLEDRPIKARPPGPWSRLARWYRRNPGLAAGITMAISAMTIGSGVALAYAQKEAKTARDLETANGILINLNNNLAASSRAAQRVAAELAIDQALTECHADRISAGLVWLGRALDHAENCADPHLIDLCRRQIAEWSIDIHPIRAAIGTNTVVHHATFSEDGSHLVVTGMFDSEPGIQVLDAQTGNPISPLIRPQDFPSAVAIHPKNAIVLFGTEQGRLHLHDSVRGVSLTASLPSLGGPIRSLYISPSGDLFLVGVHRTAPRLIERTGSVRATLKLADSFEAASFSADGTILYTAHRDGARCWDTQTGNEIALPSTLGTQRCYKIAAHPNGKMLLTASNKEAQLWDRLSGQPIGNPLPHPALVEYIAFGRDSKTIVTVDSQSIYRIWHLADSRLLAQSRGSLLANQRGIAWSPDGAYLTAVRSSRLRESGTDPILWAAPPAFPVAPLLVANGSVLAVGFGSKNDLITAGRSPDGSHFLLQLFDRNGNAVVATREPTTGVLPAPNGSLVLSANGALGRLWDMQTGEIQGKPIQHQSAITACLFSPEGNQLLALGRGAKQEHGLLLVDTKTGEALVPPNELGFPRSLAFRVSRTKPAVSELVALSPDGRTVFSRSTDPMRELSNRIQVQLLRDGKAIGSPLPTSGSVRAGVFRFDGQVLATGTTNGAVERWDAHTGALLLTAKRHGNAAITALAFRQDGLLLSGDVAGVLQLWHPTSGEATTRLMPHPGGILKARFSSDGQTVITLAADKLLRRWDVATGRQLGRPIVHGGPVNCWAMTADGRFLASGGPDAARVWALALPVRGEAKAIIANLQIQTGVELDDVSAVRVLEMEQWRQRRFAILAAPASGESPR